MNKIISFRLVMILALIITIYACNTSSDSNLKTGDYMKGADSGGMIWTVRFKPNSNGYYRQKCLYIVSKALSDSVKASGGYQGQSFFISQIFEPTGDTLDWKIKLNMNAIPPNFSFRFLDSIPVGEPVGPPPSQMFMSDTIPVGEPAGPPPGLASFYIFCVQPGDMACQ
jgi:hypothetical protein